MPGADQWSLLWAWECKDLGRTITVDDVEEFWAKLEQIGSKNVKGGFASRTALQKSALMFAMAKGISVVRLLDRSQIEFIMHHPGPSGVHSERHLTPRQAFAGLTTSDIRSEAHVFCGDGELFFDDFSRLL